MESETVAERTWPPLAIQLLLAIAQRSTVDSVTWYEPAVWFNRSPTACHRMRWSRWTRRLADAGLIRRLTEPNRDRVREVTVTPSGLEWIAEHCGGGALSNLNLVWSDSLNDFALTTNSSDSLSSES